MTAETAIPQAQAVQMLEWAIGGKSLPVETHPWIQKALRKHVLTNRDVKKCFGLNAPEWGMDATRTVLLKKKRDEQIERLHKLCGSPYWRRRKLLAPITDVFIQIEDLRKKHLDEGLNYEGIADAVIPPDCVTDKEAFFDCVGYLVAGAIPPDGGALPISYESLRDILTRINGGKATFTTKKKDKSASMDDKKKRESVNGTDKPKLRIIGSERK